MGSFAAVDSDSPVECWKRGNRRPDASSAGCIRCGTTTLPRMLSGATYRWRFHNRPYVRRYLLLEGGYSWLPVLCCALSTVHIYFTIITHMSTSRRVSVIVLLLITSSDT